MLTIIIIQTILAFIFIFYSMNNIRKYTLGLTEVYLKYINPEHSIKNNEYISAVIKDNPPIKYKKRLEEKYSKKRKIKHLSAKKLVSKNLKIDQDNEESETKNISIFNPFLSKKKGKKRVKSSLNLKGYYSNTIDNSKINKYMDEYLSTPGDDMDYDDAKKRDNRKFFRFFWERITITVWPINIIFSKEKLKPRSIRILCLLLNIDLYFFINGLYFNEEYISEVYHSNEEEHFFDFISRTNYNLFYASMVGAFVEYLIKCFFVEEKRLKNLFRREKDNETTLRYELSLILKLIKSRYIGFFITSYIIAIFSWYYASCFNNVYPNMRFEWIKSSFFIMGIMTLVYIGLALLESILRFLSFKFQSEKLFKFSKIFANCC